MIYFTADLHLGHYKIIEHCHRPFRSAEEMDAALIDNWNASVGQEDEVYILGDFTMRPAADAHTYVSRLHGRKYLIIGNHDRFVRNYSQYERDFVWMKDYFVLRKQGYRIVLFHYPILEWDQFFRDAIHLYGHIHNNEKSVERASQLSGAAINVGVDLCDFRPVSIVEVFERAQTLLRNDEARGCSERSQVTQ